MLKDINPIHVEDIAVAVVREANEWNVYLLNLKNVRIEGVLVSSKGYGENNGEQVKTSVLRHFLDVLEPQTYKMIEPIPENLHGLSNEYWVSFYIDRKMQDKKYIFLAETILESNFVNIPLLNVPGVMIK